MLLNVLTHQAHQYRIPAQPHVLFNHPNPASLETQKPTAQSRGGAQHLHHPQLEVTTAFLQEEIDIFLTFSISYAHHCAVFCLIFKPVHTLPLLSWYFSATTRKYTYRNLTLYCLKVTQTPIPVAQKSKQPLTKARLAHQALEACPASPPLKQQL